MREELALASEKCLRDAHFLTIYRIFVSVCLPRRLAQFSNTPPVKPAIRAYGHCGKKGTYTVSALLARLENASWGLRALPCSLALQPCLHPAASEGAVAGHITRRTRLCDLTLHSSQICS